MKIHQSKALVSWLQCFLCDNLFFFFFLFLLKLFKIKGELRNRFNFNNFRRKSKILWTKQWKPDENLLKNKEVMTLWIFANFHISWPVDMNMQMSELMMSSPHYLPYVLYMKFWKIQYFAHTCDSTCMSLISSCIGVNIILHLFRKELRQV